MAAVLSLIAAITAALIARSVMISNHRQAWINGLREDLATFFSGIDVIHSGMAMPSPDARMEQQKARNDVLLAYRKILMRLNMSEPLHQQLQTSLESLLVVQDRTDQDELAATVTLARTILKREWEVTKYGSLIGPVSHLKRRRRSSGISTP
jgi:hypothetical protein